LTERLTGPMVPRPRSQPKVLGLDNEIGSLEGGKRADLVAVARDPLEDVSALENVSFVMKDGRVVKAPEEGSR